MTEAGPARPERRARTAPETWACIAVLGGWWGLVLLFARPHSSFGTWLFGYRWYWISATLWVVTAIATIIITWVFWRRVVPVLVVAVLAAGLVAYAQLPFSPRASMSDPQAWFAQHRTDFTKAVRWAGFDCCGGADAYLPDDLSYLTVDGTLSGSSNHLFFPQWRGIPDDAGGYLYSPLKNPRGDDMDGEPCEHPVDLGKGWWMCGLKAS